MKAIVVNICVLILGILSLQFYLRFDSSVNRQRNNQPAFKFCNENNAHFLKTFSSDVFKSRYESLTEIEKERSEICKGKHQYKNVLFLYYDGVGLKYLRQMAKESIVRDKFSLNELENTGISDTGPALFTLMSGTSPFTYDDNLRHIGNLINFESCSIYTIKISKMKYWKETQQKSHSNSNNIDQITNK